MNKDENEVLKNTQEIFKIFDESYNCLIKTTHRLSNHCQRNSEQFRETTKQTKYNFKKYETFRELTHTEEVE